MNASNRKSVAVIDPSPVVRQGVKSLLETAAGGGEFGAVKTFCDVVAFRDSVPTARFDLILFNPSAVSSYKHFNVRELLPGRSDTPLVALVRGYVDTETLAGFDGSVDIYCDGERMAARLKKIAREFASRQDGDAGGDNNVALSEREKEILVAVARGMTNKRIAAAHNISVHTVISHRKNITRKTDIKTVSALTIYAVLNDLVSQEEL